MITKTPASILKSNTMPSENFTIRRPKTVSFDTIARVILIPLTQEYVKAGLAPKLWISRLEFETFKQESIEEIEQYMQNTGLCAQTTRKELYQPSPAAKDLTKYRGTSSLG